MPLFSTVRRPAYHKHGTQFFGKIFQRLIGENNYEFYRLEKRIFYARFWYTKQKLLLRFQLQYPHIAVWFSILNKQDTSDGFPAYRVYERHQDFAIFNINSEGWFQVYFIALAFIVIIFNWYIVAFAYDLRG